MYSQVQLIVGDKQSLRRYEAAAVKSCPKMKHFITIVICFISIYIEHVWVLNQTEFCAQDMSEVMFQASTLVLAKVKRIRTKHSVSLLEIRISKVIKSNPEYPIKQRKKVNVLHEHKFCKPIKAKRKYVFSLSYKDSKWHLECRPVTASKKIKKIMQNLFCAQCGKGPTVRAISSTMNVKIHRYTC